MQTVCDWLRLGLECLRINEPLTVATSGIKCHAKLPNKYQKPVAHSLRCTPVRYLWCRTRNHVLLRDAAGGHLLSDGFRTYEKVPLAFLVAHWASMLSGIVGLAWLLVAGLISTVRHRAAVIRRPEGPAFAAVLCLLIPVPFFMAQSYMAIGDLTLASTLLAIATLVLPAAMILTIMRAANAREKSLVVLAHGGAAILVLQWCAVLAKAGLIPFRLWA